MSDVGSEPMSESPESLARTWLRAWDEYLRIAEPMSRKTVNKITLRDVIGGENKAAIPGCTGTGGHRWQFGHRCLT